MNMPSDFEAPARPTEVTLVTELCHGAIRYLARSRGHFTRDPRHAFPFSTPAAAEACAAELARDPTRPLAAVTFGTLRYDLAQADAGPGPDASWEFGQNVRHAG